MLKTRSDSIESLIRSITLPEKQHRKQAVSHLSAFDSGETMDALVAALSDPCPQVATQAARSLISIGGTRLIRKLMSDMLIWDS